MTRPNWTLGTNISNWILHHITSIPELGSLTAYQFKHPSRAVLVYCHRDDPFQTFSISFRTPVKDSKGTPHILEHVALCGSKKYPVRDPFFRMLNRSLAAYMNAWTASDHTTYPFVTENLKDYEHLRDVYWDAVFNPLLRMEDFEQEGWRMERDGEGERKFAGVVFNEMKGALSDADSVFGTRLNKFMLSGTEYEHISGGDPLHIPRLTHRDLVEFHRKHYQPSNALIMTYGSTAPDFEFLDKKISEMDSSVGVETESPPELAPFSSSPWFVTTGPLDPLGDPLRQTRFIKSFLVGKVDDLQRNFDFSMLAHLLLDGPSSPMYQALIESGLGAAYAPGTGFDSHSRYTTFSVGVQGMLEGDARRVSGVIDDVLLKTSMDGFPESRIEAALDAIEISLKHQPALFGLGLVSKVAAHWTRSHGSIAECLKIQERLDAFKQNTGILKRLTQQYLLPSNKQSLSLTQLVNTSYFERRAEQEAKVLASIPDSSNAAVTNKSLDDSSILPILSEADIQDKVRDRSIKGEGGGNLFYRQTGLSNGITYFRTLMPIHTTKLYLLPLLCEAITELGVEGMSAAEFSEAIKRHTGGISVSPLLTHDGQLFLQFSSYSLNNKFDHMLELLLAAIKTANWNDHNRLKTIVQQLASSINSGIADSGHSYAKCRAASSFSPVQAANEAINGLSFVEALNQTSHDYSKLASDLYSLVSSIDSINRSCIITDQSGLDPSKFTSQFGFESKGYSVNAMNGALETDIQMPFDTNFVAAVRQIPTSNAVEIASLLLLSKVLRSRHLHPQIREKGGAYGADASFNSLTSLFSMTSYRDPNPDRTVSILSDLTDFDENSGIDESSVREAKLAHFSSADSPKEVGDQGLSEFLHGYSDEKRQEIRMAILNCNVAGIREALGVLRNSEPRVCTIRKNQRVE